MGGVVVLDLIFELRENEQYDLFSDNFFTFTTLIYKLSEKRRRATGTMRVIRIENCPLEDIKSIKKKIRGSFDFQNSKNLKMVRWKDNSCITLASNHYGFEPIAQTKRWLNIDEKFIEIDQPNILSQYKKKLLEAPIVWIKTFHTTGVPYGLKTVGALVFV
ncbi:putative piggybac transposable element-derived [Nephila pilipes]|uniref:Putative piggybac transposable element-derived n=1 Tax=Nephila pilipes TaxID=299642 RepID=A0A8X6P0P7_NEPPI|nr:putative piggybac transposable element-derived [Nephila pilipes]